VLDPWPGSSVFQTRFDSGSSLSGSDVSVVEPFKLGPRHCGQFSPSATLTYDAIAIPTRAAR
jgi:hypothetical protein